MALELAISTPKLLSADDWKSLFGSDLHSLMVRNRSEIKMQGGGSAADRTRLKQVVVDWLRESCKSLYFISPSTPMGEFTVYIEGDPDAVNFKIFFEGYELPEEEPEQPQPKVSSPSQASAHDILERIKQRQVEKKKAPMGWDDDDDLMKTRQDIYHQKQEMERMRRDAERKKYEHEKIRRALMDQQDDRDHYSSIEDAVKDIVQKMYPRDK